MNSRDSKDIESLGFHSTLLIGISYGTVRKKGKLRMTSSFLS